MKPIQLDFKSSMWVCALFTLMSLGALSIVILLDLSRLFNWQIQCLLGAVIVISAVYAILQHGLLLLPWSCVGLKVSKNSQLELILKNGDILEVVPQPNSVVTLYLIVLNCRKNEAGFIYSLTHGLFHQHYIIFFDSVNADDYRQLRVWLHWAACHSAAIKQGTPL